MPGLRDIFRGEDAQRSAEAFGTLNSDYPIKTIAGFADSKDLNVDIQDKSWNRLEAYILKWYPILEASHGLALE
jgi:hypothetical protein